MKSLKWWMRIVGTFFVIIFLGSSILQIGADMNLESIGGTPNPGDITYRLLVDTWFILGWTFAVMGGALLYGSRRPTEHTLLVWMVLGWELLVGIVSDIYMLIRGTGTTAEMSFYIVVHTIIILWGYLALRKTQKSVIEQEL